IGLMNEALVSAVLIILLFLAIIVFLRRTKPPRLVVNKKVWMVVGVYGVHLLFTFVMQSFTEKYINEIRELGTIYISYGSAVLVMATAFLLFVGLMPRRFLTTGLVVLALMSVFFVVQQSTNWSLASYYAVSYEECQAITENIVTDSSTNEDRCSLLGS